MTCHDEIRRQSFFMENYLKVIMGYNIPIFAGKRRHLYILPVG